MPYSDTVRKETLTSIADARYVPFWLDQPARPAPEPELTQDISTDLLIVGAGFTGLWTALLAMEANPSREVVILEGGETATGASGRNGGFLDASITHGLQNGLARWPREFPTLLAMGMKNLDEIEATIRHLGIECDYLRTGDISMASEPYQVEELQAEMEVSARYHIRAEFFEREAIQKMVRSPFFIAGLNYPDHAALVNPAQLAWGLRRACLELGVRLFEHSPVTKLGDQQTHVVAQTRRGRVRARRVALATNAFPPLIRRLSNYVVPVYDYVLVTEPLTPAQRESIGWHGREGLSDASRQFHYTRTTADGRILWGGYDAIYYWNNGFGTRFENDRGSFARLAEHFFQVFPQLEGIRFSHAWGGAIDTCSRFSPFWGTEHGGKTAYALGYTGLGVGASRFGARVILDLLEGGGTERTALEMVRTKPLPFPPEPLRSIGIRLSRWSMAQADAHEGRENLWLRLMSWLGLGFDS
jgi:glycine/D-amino acid oxidase-like deaminating enzyme